MPNGNITFFDTDMFIHRLSNDLPVRKKAEIEFKNRNPSAMSEFSIVEFKGNYIAALILLRRKVGDSDSFESAYSRIQNSGGRKAILMLAQLIKWLGGTDFPINPWSEAQNKLITYLDAQIDIVWTDFLSIVDHISRQFNCTRATEEPQENNGKWSATIFKCSENNTKCNIDDFFQNFQKELTKLVSDIDNLEPGQKTAELDKIFNVSKQILKNKKFSWQGQNCRRIGDLLIGLESKIGFELLSSNYKEHSVLSKALGYTLNQFPYAQIRSK